MVDKSGEVGAKGSINLKLNPPQPSKEDAKGVTFDGAWVRAELDDGKLTVTVTGLALYEGRTITSSIQLEEKLVPLRSALQEILDAYHETIKGKVLAAAYEAHSVAARMGETGGKPDGK